MTGFELVAGVIGIFFATGLAVGVLVAVVLGGFRRRRDRRFLDSHDWPRQPLAPPPRPPEPPEQDDRPPWWQDG